MGGGAVDPSTGDFTFSVNEAYIVRNGQICELVKGASLIGNGPKTLMNISKIANNKSLASGICGSISGMIPAAIWQPAILVSKIMVGGRS